jgi:2-oxoglutarate ferredoxin oxidoreductase subunit beta
MVNEKEGIYNYLRTDKKFPPIWCPGCGNGIVMGSMLRAIAAIGLNKDKVAVVSGIGCSGRTSTYVDFNTLHTTHGRAITFATGLKLARPDMTVLVVMGDGDALAIGGNHFIHAARRNLDMTAVVMNNRIYGMTGGQFSPLSGAEVSATTAPYRTIDRSFDVAELSKAAGATFVARTTSYHAQQITSLIEKAISHKGFSVVEILSQCPTYFGRKNRLGGAADMMKWYKENTTSVGSKAKQENPALIERGVFEEREAPEYCEEYQKIVERAMGGRN